MGLAANARIRVKIYHCHTICCAKVRDFDGDRRGRPLGVKLQIGCNGVGGEVPLCRARRFLVPAVEGVALALGRDGFGRHFAVLDGLRRGQGVHIIAVRAERHGVVRRGRGDSQISLLCGENAGCVEKSGRDSISTRNGIISGKLNVCIVSTVRSGRGGDGSVLSTIRKINITGDIGHGRDRKRLARFGIGRVHGHRLDDVLDHDA